MKNPYNNNIIIVGSILLVLVIGCNNKSATARTDNGGGNIQPAARVEPTAEIKPMVDIPQLANKSPEEVEKILGEAVEVNEIKSYSELYPGEFRNYAIDGLTDTLQVRFHKGKSVHFVLTLPKEKQTKKAEELAKLAGFDVSTGRQAAKFAVVWEGTFSGVSFAQVKVINSNVDDYFNLTAEVQKS